MTTMTAAPGPSGLLRHRPAQATVRPTVRSGESSGPVSAAGPSPAATALHDDIEDVERFHQLARLVKAARLRLDPAETSFARNGRNSRTVSQESVAHEIGVTVGWYGVMERGKPARYSTKHLEDIARVLRLSPQDRVLLFLYAVQMEPPALTPVGGKLTDGVRRFVDQCPAPCLAVDGLWDVVGWNYTAQDWMPWLGGHERNLARWTLTSTEARQQLCDWQRDWAPGLITRLKTLSARQTDKGNRGLRRLVRELRSDSLVDRIWGQLGDVAPDAVYGTSNLPAVRAMHLPFSQDPVRVELVISDAPGGTRTVTIMPLEDVDHPNRP